jgi:hypothetical protein
MEATISQKKTEVIPLGVTDKGYPLLYELGGACRNTAEATVIANPNGGKAKAFFMPMYGHMSNGVHAYIAPKVGMYILNTSYCQGERVSTIKKIVALKGASATVETVWEYSSSGPEDKFPPQDFLKCAYLALLAKASDYHCRSVYWAVPKQKQVKEKEAQP